MRKYEYELSPHKFAKELSGLIYYNHDNYLAFTSAVDYSGMYSIFMIFGFANGTDFTIDISPHLMDTGEYTAGNDLVTRLLKNMTIDNNIFGYVPIEKIILISYPPELLFYYSDGTTPIPNGTIIDNTHILNQNTRINKTHRLYYLEYQYMVKEQDYSQYISYASSTYYAPSGSTSSYQSNFSPKTFYGRTNRLAFKLCHDYCETCNQFGLSIHFQKCYS